ncbi:MAG: hypothetical protein SGPRY_013163, partial [Prymnesium sp.]
LTDAQSDAFWSCRWDEIDMVNAVPNSPHQGGFLALRHLENDTKYSFSPFPDEGYSWTDVIDRQLDFVRYLNGLPAVERQEWQAWAEDNFNKHVLARAQTLYKASLLTAGEIEDAQPIVVARRTFPSYCSTEPIVLAGTTPSASRAPVGPNDEKGRERETKFDAPGSKSGLAKSLEDGSLYLASKVGDTKAVAASLKVNVEDYCWP